VKFVSCSDVHCVACRSALNVAIANLYPSVSYRQMNESLQNRHWYCVSKSRSQANKAVKNNGATCMPLTNSCCLFVSSDRSVFLWFLLLVVKNSRNHLQIKKMRYDGRRQFLKVFIEIVSCINTFDLMSVNPK
jgi:hypothetical protein